MTPLVPPLAQNYFGLTRYNGIPYALVSPPTPEFPDTIYPTARVSDFFRYLYRASRLRVVLRMEVLREGLIFTADQDLLLPRYGPIPATFAASFFSTPMTPAQPTPRIRQLILGPTGLTSVTGTTRAQVVSAPGQPPVPPYSVEVGFSLGFISPGSGVDSLLHLDPVSGRYVLGGLEVSTTVAQYGIIGRFLGSDYATGTPPGGKDWQGRLTIDFEIPPETPDLEL